MKRFVLLVCACLWMAPTVAANDGVRVWSIDKTLDVAYKVIYRHLESNKFYVVAKLWK